MRNNKYSSDGPSSTKCDGCGRYEIHKMCPAYGTAFYMSGYEFTKEIEEGIKRAKTKGINDMDVILLGILKKYCYNRKGNFEN